MLKRLIVSFIAVCMCLHSSSANQCDDLSDKKLDKKPSLKKSSHIHHEIQVEINKNPKDVSTWFDNLAPEKVIKGTALVSGVNATCLISEKSWGEIGSRRLVFKNSGSSFQEEVLENIPHKLFRYQMWDFSKDVTGAIRYADAYFEVIEVDEKKSILKWHIAFRPSSFIYRIPLSIYLNTSFKPFMVQSLDDIKNYIESN